MGTAAPPTTTLDPSLLVPTTNRPPVSRPLGLLQMVSWLDEGRGHARPTTRNSTHTRGPQSRSFHPANSPRAVRRLRRHLSAAGCSLTISRRSATGAHSAAPRLPRFGRVAGATAVEPSESACSRNMSSGRQRRHLARIKTAIPLIGADGPSIFFPIGKIEYPPLQCPIVLEHSGGFQRVVSLPTKENRAMSVNWPSSSETSTRRRRAPCDRPAMCVLGLGCATKKNDHTTHHPSGFLSYLGYTGTTRTWRFHDARICFK